MPFTKKFSIIVITLILFLLPGCDHIKIAMDYSEKSIDNAYYNYVNGGKIAYYNHCLYYVRNSQMTYDNTYIINSKGARIMSDVINSSGDWSVVAPKLYQYGNTMLIFSCLNNYDIDAYRYNFISKSCSEAVNTVNWSPSNYYSDNFVVEFTYDDNGDSLMNVRYKKNDTYQIHSYDKYTVYQDVVYYSNSNVLFQSNPIKDEKSEYITEFDCIPDKLLVNDQFCYCYGATSVFQNENYTPTLYRYSFDDRKMVKLCEKKILSMNTIDNHIFFSTEDGVYTDEGNECIKITDIHAEEIYIVDEKWIYLNDNSTNLYRVTHEGSITERIEINNCKT